MSRNAKMILIAVLVVVLAACLVLAFTLPGKDAGNGKENTGEINGTAGQTTEGTETAGTEDAGKEDLDITIDIDIPDTTDSSGNGNSGSGSSGNGSSGNGSSGGQTGTKVELEIDFDDLLGGNETDKDEDKNDNAEPDNTDATKPTENKGTNNNGAAKVEDQDITIEF